MTKSELLTKILTNRINSEKAKGTTDFTEIQNTMDIFLAGGSITTEQYTELLGLIPQTVTAQAKQQLTDSKYGETTTEETTNTEETTTETTTA